MEALRALDLDGETALSGRWVELRGERFPVYVAGAAFDYYPWCGAPGEGEGEFRADPPQTILSGLRPVSR